MPAMNAIRGPEPFVGAVYVARTRSGRRWEVWREGRWGWHLAPMGASGGFGGVKWIWRTAEQLQDRKRWRMVGVTNRSVQDFPCDEDSSQHVTKLKQSSRAEETS